MVRALLGALFRLRVCRPARNGGGDGGERCCRGGLSRLLLGGRSWKQPNPPPFSSKSDLPVSRKGQVLRAIAASTVRAVGSGSGPMKARDAQLAGSKQVLMAWVPGLGGRGSFSPSPQPY